MRHFIFYLIIVVCMVLWPVSLVSCSQGEEPEAPRVPLRISFTVSAAQSRVAASDAGLEGEEQDIRSLWVYAFDDNYPHPDYFKDEQVGDAITVTSEYKVQMDIYGEGTKRFYVIANPPDYIRTQLTEACSEDLLKTLSLQMQAPIYDMSQLPQGINGLSGTGYQGGFPMSNVVNVEARLTAPSSREMKLYAPDATQTYATAIQSIPLIRSLGKVTVKAYLKTGDNTPVTVNGLKLYNYTANGLFVPVWQDAPDEWTAAGEWNTGRLLDLEALARHEDKVQNTAAQVFTASGTGDQSTGYISDSNNSANAAKELTAFYLCQNSYGEMISNGSTADGNLTEGDMQPGVEDKVGNRTTRLVVSLSDGRVSEVRLPYLRRNDRLTVRLCISEYSIRFEFEQWMLTEVNPDWEEKTIDQTP